MDIGDRYLGSGNQPKIPLLYLEEVFLKFRQLTGSGHCCGVDHKGWQHLSIAVLLGVQVKKKAGQGPGKSGPKPLEQGKTRSRQLGRSLKIENVQGFADLPVGFRGKGKLWNITPELDLHIITVIIAPGNRVVTEVGNGSDHLIKLSLDIRQLTVQSFDSFRDLAHLHY